MSSWWNFTTPLEPILGKTAKKYKPRRLAHASVRCAPPEKSLCIFEISPAEIFWIWKRDFSVGSPAINGRGGVARSGKAAMCRKRHILKMTAKEYNDNLRLGLLE